MTNYIAELKARKRNGLVTIFQNILKLVIVLAGGKVRINNCYSRMKGERKQGTIDQ